MIEILKALVKQPYWVFALLLGAFLITLPSVTIDKDYHWSTHPPTTLVPVLAGCVLFIVSFVGFAATLVSERKKDEDGIDLTYVKESHGVLSTKVGDCEVRVVEGRIEEFAREPRVAMVLPCSEYFDDRCVTDTRSALGVYVARVFGDQAHEFGSFLNGEARRKFGKGTIQKKTHDEEAESFGSGKCILLLKPLGRTEFLALISTSTQRAGQGLTAQISCLFEGMHELSKALADARINEVVMPVLGGGHGGIHTPLALIGLLLAVAEVAKYGHGAQRLRGVTIIVFKKDAHTPAEVQRPVVRRALALIGSGD